MTNDYDFNRLFHDFAIYEHGWSAVRKILFEALLYDIVEIIVCDILIENSRNIAWYKL